MGTHTQTCVNVYNNPIHILQKLEAIQMFFNKVNE